MNNKTQLVVVSSYFYPKIGGVENYAYNIAKILQKEKGYDVTVITTDFDGRQQKKENIDGLEVYRLPIWFKVSNTPIDPSWLIEIKKIFKKIKPDIIHLHSPVPGMVDLAAVAAGKSPVVITYHSGSMLKNRFPIDLLIGTYENTFLRMFFDKARAIVSISKDYADKKLSSYKDKVGFISGGVDLERFRPLPLPVGETITYVGRVEHNSNWKGVKELLQAMAMVVKERSQTKLEIIGNGDAVEFYKNYAKELGIADFVTFYEALLGKDLVEAYARSNVVVLPSTSEAESFGMVLLEAMASGRPVIGSNIGGIPQIIDEGVNGLLVEPKNIPALSEAIKKILSDRTLAERFANAGIEKAKKFSWKIQAEKYDNLFKKILEKN